MYGLPGYQVSLNKCYIPYCAHAPSDIYKYYIDNLFQLSANYSCNSQRDRESPQVVSTSHICEGPPSDINLTQIM